MTEPTTRELVDYLRGHARQRVTYCEHLYMMEKAAERMVKLARYARTLEMQCDALGDVLTETVKARAVERETV